MPTLSPTPPTTHAPERDNPAPTASDDRAFEYRSVHSAAVLGLLLGALSVVITFSAGSGIEPTLLLAPLPLLGLGVSLYAWRSIHEAPEVYTGATMARAGAALSAFFLVGGLGYASYVHATEVPEGYSRTSFIAMKPSEEDVVNRRFVPEEVESLILDGAKVFLKGYIRPDSVSYTKNINSFLLVRDNQECCFGDMSKVKYFDQIKVQLTPGLMTDFSRSLFRLGGTMRVGPGDARLGTPLTYYLEADYVKP